MLQVYSVQGMIQGVFHSHPYVLVTVKLLQSVLRVKGREPVNFLEF